VRWSRTAGLSLMQLSLGCSPKTIREIVERVGMADGFRRNSDRRLQQKKRAKERIAVLRHGDGRDR